MKCMKHMVATYAHLLASLQWTLVDTEVDASTELEVTHGQQVDGSQPRREARDVGHVARGMGGAWHKARARLRSARRETWGHAARGMGARGSVLSGKNWCP
jgi:hypothetical protein